MEQEVSRGSTKRTRWGTLLFVVLGLGLILAVGKQQPASWASSRQSRLGDTIPDSIIDGTVTLQRHQPIGDSSWIVQLLVTVYPAGQSTPINSGTLTTDSMGKFIYPVLEAGTYDIHVKNPHTLSNRKAGTVLVEGLNTLDFGLLLEGDATNDDRINTLDWSRLYSTFGGSDQSTDFNQDGSVNVLDYSWLYNNFWLSGPRPVLSLSHSRPTVNATDAVTVSVEAGSAFVGWTSRVPISVQTGGRQVDAAEVHLTFDPTILQIVDAAGRPATQLEPGTALGQVIRNGVDNLGGTVHYAAGAKFEDPPATGDFELAGLYIKPVRAIRDGTEVTIVSSIIARSGMPYPVQMEHGVFHPGIRGVFPLLYGGMCNGSSTQ